jgi:hypothetical protein
MISHVKPVDKPAGGDQPRPYYSYEARSIYVCHMQTLRVYPDTLPTPFCYNVSVSQETMPNGFRYP